MHRRPSLKEALQVLSDFSCYSEDAAEVLDIYKKMIINRQEFLAARLVVEIVDLFYHKTERSNG
jgi:hypothetical protein